MTGRPGYGGPQPGEDWGAENLGAQTVDSETPTPSYRLVDVRLDEEVTDAWPDPAPKESRSELDRARAALVANPGQVRRLGFVFDDRASAETIAKGFAEAGPAAVVPGAGGRFEAVVEKVAGRWRVAVRYVAATLFPDSGTWMAEWLVPVVRRPMRAGVTWCPQWWDHPEALVRVDALWRAWEAARTAGGEGMSMWWITHFESHWAALTDSARGPFAACKDQTHEGRLEPLACDSPPEDLEWPNT